LEERGWQIVKRKKNTHFLKNSDMPTRAEVMDKYLEGSKRVRKISRTARDF